MSRTQNTPQERTDTLALAARFVNSTGQHIFLTGKAGTGKTTFLQNLAKATHKKFAIVAPTGIAALNAGGVTIHSQFLLPFGTFLPADIPGEPPSPSFYSSKGLARRHPLNSARKQVLRDIELLIIDEVSMLRADLLDAIDYRLKAAKGIFNKSFGGVQLLMIGDLYQLPPIVKEFEWSRMRRFYPSPHFFESVGLKQNGFIYIELDKIFRQRDGRFITLLNNLRNNTCTQADIDTLNAHYQPKIKPDDGLITLTTHNRQADDINQSRLDALSEKIHTYTAIIDGDFPENLYPLSEKLELKVGAQVMFVKNDGPENRFYNGKLAKVTALNPKEITVEMADEDRTITLEKMDWENKKYELNPTSKELLEKVTGTFTHYPIKLAWAITVHKSQGLTFDKAIVDVGQAFAPGQVYVALSRLRSLEGLILRTRISHSAISCDAEVVRFSDMKATQGSLPSMLKAGQEKYLRETLRQTFDFEPIVKQIDLADQKTGGSSGFTDADMRVALPQLRQKFRDEQTNTFRFQNQIATIIDSGDHTLLRHRIAKGSTYYLKFMDDRLQELLIHKAEVGMLQRTKTYANALSEIDQLISRNIADLQKAAHIADCILSGKEVERKDDFERKRLAMREVILSRVAAHVKENPKNIATKTGRSRKSKPGSRKKKPGSAGNTYQTTYDMVRAGKQAEEIARERSMAISTIEGHLSRGIKEGALKLEQVLDKDTIETIQKGMEAIPDGKLTDIFAYFKGAVPFGQLRMVQAAKTSKENE